MSLVVVCFLAVSGDQSHDVVLFPYDPQQTFGSTFSIPTGRMG